MIIQISKSGVSSVQVRKCNLMYLLEIPKFFIGGMSACHTGHVLGQVYTIIHCFLTTKSCTHDVRNHDSHSQVTLSTSLIVNISNINYESDPSLV